MAESLYKYPFMDCVNGQKDNGFGVETDVSNGLFLCSRGKIVLCKDRIHGKHDQVVVEIDCQSNDESSDDPMLEAQIPGIEEPRIVVIECAHGRCRARIEDGTLDLDQPSSIHYCELRIANCSIVVLWVRKNE